MVQQPIQKKEVHITSGSDVLKLKTDANGALPALYPDLFISDLNFHFGNPAFGIGTEKIGTVSSGMFKNDLSFVAPYLVTTSTARLHESKAPEQALVHIVKSGETLTGIAAKYGVSRDDLATINKITDVNRIFDRQHLKIPPGGSSETSPDAATRPPAATQPPRPQTTGAISPAPPAAASKPPAPPATPGTARLPAATHSPVARAAAPATAVSVEHQRTDKKHPVTVLSSPTLTPSGAAWCNRFLGSNSLDSLNAYFKPKAKGFIGALRAAGITVTIRAAYRPIERSHLMYYAFEIARGMDAIKVPAFTGISIDWAHRSKDGTPDAAAAKAAAEAMCRGYGIKPHSASQKVGRPKRSRHNYAAAIDMNVGAYIGKTVKNGTGDEVKLVSFTSLKAVGESYGAIYFPLEKMHWSDTGS
jgi:hypothetical protein